MVKIKFRSKHSEQDFGELSTLNKPKIERMAIGLELEIGEQSPEGLILEESVVRGIARKADLTTEADFCEAMKVLSEYWRYGDSLKNMGTKRKTVHKDEVP